MAKTCRSMRAPSKRELERVVVVGSSGSGKTTLARQLAQLLGSCHIELDAVHWEANWKARSIPDFRRLVAEAVSGDRWVIDGNYSAVRDLVWSRATAAVWLNYPFRLVFRRVLSRTVRRALTREELYSGNRESFRKAFMSSDSILLWVITSFRRHQRDYATLRESHSFPQVRFWELRRPSETSLFLSSLAAAVRRSAADAASQPGPTARW
jgi:adenylate kinase family enzyme